MAILDDVKVALRVAATTTTFDGEIGDLITAALADLKMAGVVADKAVSTDTLVKRAVITYCKAYFGYDNPDSDRLAESYLMLKQHLALCGDYNQFVITFTVTTAGLVPIDEATIAIEGIDDPLVTNSQGVALYRLYKSGIDVDYTVSASGYVDVTSSVYVDGQETVGVVLNAT